MLLTCSHIFIAVYLPCSVQYIMYLYYDGVFLSLSQSMLRIWDCFLYEGRKVLYRFTLAILKLNERKLLQMYDPNAILSYLKKLPKHIFNMDELFNVS